MRLGEHRRRAAAGLQGFGVDATALKFRLYTYLLQSLYYNTIGIHTNQNLVLMIVDLFYGAIFVTNSFVVVLVVRLK